VAEVPLRELAQVIRSKNAGPFELTFDILFNRKAAYEEVKKSGALTPDAREARSRWASTRLTAQAGAEYFMKIVGHRLDGGPRPTEFYQ